MHDNITLDSSGVAPAESVRRFRRLVTGIGQDGRSVFVEDGQAAHLQVVANTPTFVVTNLWSHDTVPVDNSGPVDDGLSGDVPLSPPLGGSVFRIVEFPPDSHWQEREDAPADQIHATPSLDYALVLSGEIWAVLDDSERLMKSGDVLIQRGTRHAWSNRGGEPSLVAFVLIGGTAQ
ncbi:cupin domain-containing protein [Microtetraspora sp. AC03309]|uniref:cupin domain-containing protein n=1 Tax=Microtetraspora sp. AC03309 TaxID=2779376 RepID=UPI001E2E1D57|nr:cupin domain-containing protein [Microtetraspora sp. AC03309]MCC5574654.1 cupin domain-containing protein [Microtetraspora sp. AC03309]